MTWRDAFSASWRVPRALDALVAAKRLSDLSHHGDNGPSFGVNAYDARGRKTGSVRMLLEHPDPQWRTNPRFMVQVGLAHGPFWLYEGDDAAPAITALRAALWLVDAKCPPRRWPARAAHGRGLAAVAAVPLELAIWFETNGWPAHSLRGRGGLREYYLAPVSTGSDAPPCQYAYRVAGGAITVLVLSAEPAV